MSLILHLDLMIPHILCSSIPWLALCKMENDKIKVAELFAGVGGFRLGLEKYDK